MCCACARSSFACLTARTVSISASRVIVSGSMLMTTRARDVVDDDRPVARARDRLEVRDDPALRRLVVVRRHDEEARRRRARAPARSGAPSARSSTCRCRRRSSPVLADRLDRGAEEVEALVVGERRALARRAGDDDAVGAVARRGAWRARWNASKSIDPSSRNGVTIAVRTLPSIRRLYVPPRSGILGGWRPSCSSTGPGTAPGAGVRSRTVSNGGCARVKAYVAEDVLPAETEIPSHDLLRWHVVERLRERARERGIFAPAHAGGVRRHRASTSSAWR